MDTQQIAEALASGDPAQTRDVLVQQLLQVGLEDRSNSLLAALYVGDRIDQVRKATGALRADLHGDLDGIQSVIGGR